MAENNKNNFKGTAAVNWIPISLTCNSYPEGLLFHFKSVKILALGDLNYYELT